MYQRIKLSTGEHIGQPDDLPAELVGLSDDDLAHICQVLDPCPDEWVDTGFVPAVAAAPKLTALQVLLNTLQTKGVFSASDVAQVMAVA